MVINLKIVLLLMIFNFKHANRHYNKYKCICLTILTYLSGTLSKCAKSPCQRKSVQVEISHPRPFPQPIKDIDHSCSLLTWQF